MSIIFILLLVTWTLNRLASCNARRNADEVTLQRCGYVDIGIIVVGLLRR